MKSFLLFTLLATLTISNMYADATDTPKKSYASRITHGHRFTEDVLFNDSLILNFVSHPKALNHFINGLRERRECLFKLKDKVDELKTKYPDHPEVNAMDSRFTNYFRLCEVLLPFEENIAPFVVLGIGNTSAITEPNALRELQTIQIKIFKNWLAYYKIGEENPHFFCEMKKYVNRSSIDVFKYILRPLLKAIEEDDGDYDDIIELFVNDDRADYMEENEEYEECNLLPPEVKAQIEAEIDRAFPPLPEGAELDEPSEESTQAIHQEIEPLIKELDVIFEKYFSRDTVILLFLEINGLLTH